jgi:hypothetical protein
MIIKTELVETKSVSRPKGTYTEFDELQWVANKPLPSVGSEVTVKVNGIGVSKVLKYFVEHGIVIKTNPRRNLLFTIGIRAMFFLPRLPNFKFARKTANPTMSFTRKHFISN